MSEKLPDTLFVDWKCDIRLKPESPDLKLGFTSIPVEKIGVREKPECKPGPLLTHSLCCHWFTGKLPGMKLPSVDSPLRIGSGDESAGVALRPGGSVLDPLPQHRHLVFGQA